MIPTIQQLCEHLRASGAQNAIIFPNGTIRIVTQWGARNFQLAPAAPKSDEGGSEKPQPQPFNPA